MYSYIYGVQYIMATQALVPQHGTVQPTTWLRGSTGEVVREVFRKVLVWDIISTPVRGYIYPPPSPPGSNGD